MKTEEIIVVWVGVRAYRLYSDGNAIRYEGNGKFIVQQSTKDVLKSNQQAR